MALGSFYDAIVENADAIAEAYQGQYGLMKNIEILGEPTLSKSHSEGQKWVYFKSPWGMQFELVSFPNGKAYEAQSRIKLWHPGKPAL